jgi:hypothetical protein
MPPPGFFYECLIIHFVANQNILFKLGLITSFQNISAMTTARNAVITTALYLLVFIITLYVPLLFNLAPWLFIASPFALIWMVVCILKDDRQKYPEPGKHEWGYRDKNRDELGLF